MNRKKPLKRRMNFSLSPQAVKTLRRVAKRSGLTMSDVVESGIRRVSDHWDQLEKEVADLAAKADGS